MGQVNCSTCILGFLEWPKIFQNWNKIGRSVLEKVLGLTLLSFEGHQGVSAAPYFHGVFYGVLCVFGCSIRPIAFEGFCNQILGKKRHSRRKVRAPNCTLWLSPICEPVEITLKYNPGQGAPWVLEFWGWKMSRCHIVLVNLLANVGFGRHPRGAPSQGSHKSYKSPPKLSSKCSGRSGD